MKQFGHDCFISSSKNTQGYSDNKLGQFMDKVNLTREISKLRNFKNNIIPHYKKLVEFSINKVANKTDTLSDKKIYKTV